MVKANYFSILHLGAVDEGAQGGEACGLPDRLFHGAGGPALEIVPLIPRALMRTQSHLSACRVKAEFHPEKLN